MQLWQANGFEGIVNELERAGARQEVVIMVFGERDSRSTLAATSIEERKAPDSQVQPLQWGCIISSSILSALTSAAVALAFAYLEPDMFPKSISFSQGVNRFFLVLFFLLPAVYLGFPLVCSIAVTCKMVSYRRRTHALIAALISLPIFFIFISLLSNVFG